MKTMATAAMEAILKQYGYDHAKLVLMCFTETRNKRELIAPSIWAVPDLARAHPAWSNRTTDWIAAFDKVDLGQLHALAKRNRKVTKQRAAIATLLFGFLSTKMDTQPAARMAA